MIDTHSHIYLPEFDQDRREVVERALSAGVEKILMPNIDAQSVRPMFAVEEMYPDYCYSMMGLHPTSVKGDYEEQLTNVEYWLGQRDFIAIGEIGIDLYWDKTWEREQRVVFRKQAEWAKEKDIPIVIHVREAFEAVFQELDKVCDDRLKGVFHSFSGNKDHLHKALGYPGFMLGLNGIVTFKNAKLDEVLKGAPSDRIMTETDAPYLAPVPYRGKRNQPAYMKNTLVKLAEVYGVTADEMDRITTRNARQLFAIDH